MKTVSRTYETEAMTNQTLGERIRIARKKAGLTQPEVANLFDISREAVSFWESNKNAPTSDKLGILARETGVRVEWLMTGQGDMEGSAPPMPTEPLDAAGKVQMTLGPLPVMGTAEGGPDGLMEWNGEIVDYVPRPAYLAGAKGAYVLNVTGSSMENRYFDGERIYVHPGKPPTKGAFVVVQFYRDEAGGTPCVWVKQFIDRNSKTTTFKQLNPRKDLTIPTSRILAVHRIVGSTET